MSQLDEAAQALEKLQSEYDAATTNLAIARSKQCAALNTLNEKQREIDQIIKDMKKKHRRNRIGNGEKGRPPMSNHVSQMMLTIKVFVIHLLIKMKLAPNVWHQCEIDLAKIRAEKLAKQFTEWGDPK